LSRSRVANDDQASNLVKEISTLQNLKGAPNIVEFYGFFIHPDYLMICMEAMDVSLKELYLETCKKFDYVPEAFLTKITVKIVGKRSIFKCRLSIICL
jgi:serine/threonine protein kinase